MLQGNRRLMLCSLLLVCLVSGGCTEDKAIALKTAAEAFRDKAVDAINATRELLIAGAIGKKSEIELTQQTVRVITAAALARKDVADGELKAAESMMFAPATASEHTKKLEDLNQAYVEFGAAFARLPEGAAFAANAVACSAALGARLVYKLTVLHDALVDAPVKYSRDQSERAASIRTAAKNGNQAEIEKAALAYLEGLKTARNDNEEARRKLAQAAEAGQEVLGLVRGYGTLSIADLLAGVTRILEIRAKHLNITSDASVQRVKDIRQQLEGDSKLSPILKVPAINTIEECKS